jgi:uncharacterized protein
MLGDARRGKFTDNLIGFGRTLRRAGLQIDSARIAMATRATEIVGMQSKADLSAALESVMVSEAQDRIVFRDLFDAYFKDPEVANKLLSQLLPSAEGKAESKAKPRVREALAPQKAYGEQKKTVGPEQEVDFDAAMTMSDQERLHHADFNQLSASEYRLVERLVRDISLQLPQYRSRRTRVSSRGRHLDWRTSIRRAAKHGGELLQLAHRRQRLQPLPLLVLIDVSGSMERYARLLLAFLHASLRYTKRKDVFAFGTHLTDLNHAFCLADTDQMLAEASLKISDFAGGTKLGESLQQFRANHARCLVGRRTLVLVITDGLDTGEQAVLDEQLHWLRMHCGKLLWLNPLLRFEGYAPLAQGAAVLAKHSHATLAVHNITKLDTLAVSIANLMKKV